MKKAPLLPGADPHGAMIVADALWNVGGGI
jgi:hypothetical protein